MIPYSASLECGAYEKGAGRAAWGGGAAQGILGPGIEESKMVGSGRKLIQSLQTGWGQDGSGREARGDALGAGDFVRPVF